MAGISNPAGSNVRPKKTITNTKGDAVVNIGPSRCAFAQAFDARARVCRLLRSMNGLSFVFLPREECVCGLH